MKMLYNKLIASLLKGLLKRGERKGIPVFDILIYIKGVKSRYGYTGHR
jgi:hypothetical protein